MEDFAVKFPESLPEFQRMFPDDGACARYLEGGHVNTETHYAEARDTTTGTLRERGPERGTRDEAEEDAEELREKWALATKVRVVSPIQTP